MMPNGSRVKWLIGHAWPMPGLASMSVIDLSKTASCTVVGLFGMIACTLFGTWNCFIIANICKYTAYLCFHLLSYRSTSFWLVFNISGEGLKKDGWVMGKTSAVALSLNPMIDCACSSDHLQRFFRNSKFTLILKPWRADVWPQQLVDSWRRSARRCTYEGAQDARDWPCFKRWNKLATFCGEVSEPLWWTAVNLCSAVCPSIPHSHGSQ